jgi:HEPN domain-containing protein
LKRFNHEEHEGARRWLVFLSVSSVSFVLKSCLEPEPGTIWLKRINHEEHEGARRWLVFLSVSFVSFVVKSCLEPEPGAIWLKRVNHEEHEEHEGGWSSSSCPSW